MKFRKIATPLTIGSFLVVLITGLCLLFRYRGGLVDPIHEISSVIFILGIILHIIVNRKAMLIHLKQPLGIGFAAFFLVLSLIAVLPHNNFDNPGNKSRLVAKKSIDLLLDSNVSNVSAITKTNEQELLKKLNNNGLVNIESKMTLREIAGNNNVKPDEILSIIIADKK
jgi:hypothetical protein